MTLKNILKSIDKKEWQFVILLMVVLIVLTAGPYLYGYFSTPTDYIFRGFHSLAPGDYNVYFSYINQVKEGSWLLKDFFTSEFQEIGTLNIVWLSVGLFAKIFNTSAVFAFHFARIVLIPVLVLVSYFFICVFFNNKFKRKLSLLLFCFASGVGGYFAGVIFQLSENKDVYLNWPIDLWVAEANIFLSVLQSPHFLLSYCGMILFLGLFYLAIENNNYRYSFFAGISGLVWFNFHPYYFLVVFPVIFVYILIVMIKSKKYTFIFHGILSLILSLPFVIYHYWLIKINYVIGIRAGQNITITPSFIYIVLGFGFLFVFALLGISWLIKNKKICKNNKYIFFVVWLLIGFIFLYLPINFQRKLLMGLQIPLIYFTIVFLSKLVEYINNQYHGFKNYLKEYKYIIAVIFFFIFCFTSFLNIVRDVYYFQTNHYYFYIEKEYIEAIDWLKDNNHENKVILSSEYTSHVIPAYSNQIVYVGHGHETIDYENKEEKMVEVFSDFYGEADVVNFLNENNIGYIVYSSLERDKALFRPEEKKYLETVFDNQEIQIYSLIK